MLDQAQQVRRTRVTASKRAAWVSLRLFIDINAWTWDPQPSIDDAEAAVLAVASGDWDEAATAEWLRSHLRSP
jgi:prophage maintenance system killer protein